MSERDVITHYWPKPIPSRRFDWSAHVDGQEENGPFGFGASREEALHDLQHELEVRHEHVPPIHTYELPNNPEL